MGDFEMTCNPVNDENVDLIPPNDKNENTEESIKKEVTFFYLFECKNISRIIIHVFVHITLLSLLEPLFYFLYVVKMEKDLFFSQIKKLINEIINDLDSESINSILSNSVVYYVITSTFGNETYIDEYFSQLKIEYDESIDENEKNKVKLETKAYYFSGISALCTILYFCFHQIIYKEKYLFWKIFLEHIILVLFIGFYEYWFFNNIILHYSPWTDSEITYYIVTCTWNKAKHKIPILNNFVKNETSCQLD
tara:strand:+ start:210 stop:962 length:753 start_codon:yes stop_codon:yes gene_type:complete